MVTATVIVTVVVTVMMILMMVKMLMATIEILLGVMLSLILMLILMMMMMILLLLLHHLPVIMDPDDCHVAKAGDRVEKSPFLFIWITYEESMHDSCQIGF